MSLTTQFQRKKQRMKLALLKGGLSLESEMRNLIAIKSGELEDSLTTDEVEERSKNVLSIDVGNEGVPYAKFVDLGVLGKTFTYRRTGKIVFSGIGQRYQGRALENTRDDILNLLRTA